MEFNADAIIAEAATQVAEQAPASKEASQEIPVESIEPEKADSGDKNDSEKPKQDHELTPEQMAKREANRQSHLNSKLAKMRRENRELKEAIERFSSKSPESQQARTGNPQSDGIPKEENYQNYGDYLEARAEWKAEQKINEKLAERDNIAAQNTQTKQIDSYLAEKIQAHSTREQEFAKQNPDYEKLVYGEYGDFMSNMPLTVQQTLVEAKDASLALYALAKEGRLESLEDMSPYQVAMEIGRAEVMGQSYLRQNKATNAPTPMSGVRGTGNPSKSLADKSVEELMKQFNS